MTLQEWRAQTTVRWWLLKVWSNGEHWVVAESPKEAVEVLLKATGREARWVWKEREIPGAILMDRCYLGTLSYD